MVGIYNLITKRMIISIALLSCVFSQSNGKRIFRGPPRSTDAVVIVGAGVAGMTAAIEVLEKGHRVKIIECGSKLGGNALMAVGGISAAGTGLQRHNGISDSPSLFYLDTVQAGNRMNQEESVDTMTHESNSVIEFLYEAGLNFSTVLNGIGHSHARIHKTTDNNSTFGISLVEKLGARLKKASEANPGSLEMMLGQCASGISVWNNYVTGIVLSSDGYKFKEVHGKAVILATGGFMSDQEDDDILLKNAPETKGMPRTSNISSGSGIKMAEALGVKLTHMERVNYYPTALIDPENVQSTLLKIAPEILRINGAILVNNLGKRFSNELEQNEYLSKQIRQTTGIKILETSNTAIMLLNDAIVESSTGSGFEELIKEGLFKKFSSAVEFASVNNLDQNELNATFENVNAYVSGESSQKMDRFGRSHFSAKFLMSEVVYAAFVTPAIYKTLGGLKIDSRTKPVMDESFAKVNGLFAAGDIVGGIHGANSLSGSSLLSSIVFGRIAGSEASSVEYHDKDGQPLQSFTMKMNDHLEL